MTNNKPVDPQDCGITLKDQMKIEFGDIDQYFPLLDDKHYDQLICLYGNSPFQLRRSIGLAILASMSTTSFRQRIGQEDAYLGERFRNYKEFLDRKLTNPMFSGVVPQIYIGGVNRQVVAEIETNPDLVNSVFYMGQQTRKPNWKYKRQFTSCSVIEHYEKQIGYGVYC